MYSINKNRKAGETRKEQKALHHKSHKKFGWNWESPKSQHAAII